MTTDDSPPDNSGGPAEGSDYELRADGRDDQRDLNLNERQKAVLAQTDAVADLRHARRQLCLAQGQLNEDESPASYVNEATAAIENILEELASTDVDEEHNDTDISIDASLQQVIDLLNARRRRIVVRIVSGMTADDVYDQGKLATLVAAQEQAVDIRQVDSSARKSVYNSLTSAHCPALNRADVINWNEQEKAIERGPTAAAVAELLNTIETACARGGPDKQ